MLFPRRPIGVSYCSITDHERLSKQISDLPILVITIMHIATSVLLKEDKWLTCVKGQWCKYFQTWHWRHPSLALFWTSVYIIIGEGPRQTPVSVVFIFFILNYFFAFSCVLLLRALIFRILAARKLACERGRRVFPAVTWFRKNAQTTKSTKREWCCLPHLLLLRQFFFFLLSLQFARIQNVVKIPRTGYFLIQKSLV